MMQIKFTATLCSALLFCTAIDAQLPASNPFSSASKLPYQAPPFNRIRTEHYKPALEAGIELKRKEIEQIANNTAPASFENTLVALEKAGILLRRVYNVFDMVSGANNNDTLQKLQEEIAPKMAALKDAIYLNTKLFHRVQAVYDNKARLNLDAESKRLLEVYFQKFLMAGARLSESDKEQLRKLNEQEAGLSAKFANQLLEATKNAAHVVNNSDELKGLSENDKAAYANNAKTRGLEGKWVITLKNTTQQPAFRSMDNRDARQKLYEASWTRAERSDSNDTRNTILKIARLRAQKARLLGFKNFAEWNLQDQMANTPAAVDDFFSKLVPGVTGKAKREADDIREQIKTTGGYFSLEAWDWDYYAEQVRKAKYNLDENEVKPYFEMNRVLEKGVFYAANKMYGISFKERKDIPVYHPDVKVYEVFDANGKSMALFYADYYKRDNKSGGAWMNNAVDQSYLLGTKPVIYNICNFAKPAPGQPALISFDDVTTMFHEFGHSLHGLFASQKYPLLSGANTARDFVEFPSQFNEHWAMEPSVLKNYAIHYKTGAAIPKALLDKISKAGSFNKGYALTEAVAAASLDLQWHKLSEEQAAAITDVDAFEKQALIATGLDIREVPPRYRSSYFLHIWNNGYQAGYYAYQWTKMLEEDAYTWFKEHGGMTRANGQRFREMVLSKGNTEDYNTMFKNFRGRPADIKSLEEELQLKETGKSF